MTHLEPPGRLDRPVDGRLDHIRGDASAEIALETCSTRRPQSPSGSFLGFSIERMSIECPCTCSWA